MARRRGYYRVKIPLRVRFLKFVQKRVADELDPDPCWIWTGGKVRKRRGIYGKFWLNGKNVSAHRVALFIKTGKMPADLEACHGPCRNTLCVNWDHLHWGTRLENEADKRRVG